MTMNLVTGGSGYFGGLLVRNLLERGEKVRVLDLNDAHDRPSEVEFCRGDIRKRADVDAAVEGCDKVFHNVAQVPLAKDDYLLRSVNVDGTQVLLEASKAAGVGKVVHTSSSAVFGIPDHNPVLPTTVPKPQEEYGAAKLAAEWACLDASSHGQDVSIVRPRTILGHGRLGIFGILFDWIADGADPIVLGDGTNKYQFIHADDLASACIAAGDKSGPGIYNIGAADVQTMSETLGHLCAYAGTGSKVRTVPAGLAEFGMQFTAKLGVTPFAPYHWLMYSHSMWFDITPAREELGWEPKFSTDQMFIDSYDWFLANDRGESDSGERSHHRQSAKQGLLSVAKKMTGVFPSAK